MAIHRTASPPRKTLYLCGLINPLVPRSSDWREEAEEALNEYFYILSPLRGKDAIIYDQEAHRTEGMTSNLSYGSKTIVTRDFNDVKNSDILLANMDTYKSPRPPTGTLYELAWAWFFRKPVIAFHEGEPFYPEHPFLQESITEFYDNISDAIERLQLFWWM